VILICLRQQLSVQLKHFVVLSAARLRTRMLKYYPTSFRILFCEARMLNYDSPSFQLPFDPPQVKTWSELIVQKAVEKSRGLFFTYSLQEE
jgi:hypothetical protein